MGLDNDNDPRFCQCGGRLERRGSYFSVSGYRRYKVCSCCGRTYTTEERISPNGDKHTPTPT